MRVLLKIFPIVVFSVCLVASVAPQDDIGMVEDGVGMGGITVGISTKSDVISLYGNDYEVVKHKKYSTEFVYKDTGMSFYVCQADPRQEVFVISLKVPFVAMTSKGIILGQSTRREVLNAYFEHTNPKDADEEINEQMDNESEDEFEGIDFSYGRVSGYPGREIVTEIDINEKSGLRQCDIKFGKPEDK